MRFYIHIYISSGVISAARVFSIGQYTYVGTIAITTMVFDTAFFSLEDIFSFCCVGVYNTISHSTLETGKVSVWSYQDEREPGPGKNMSSKHKYLCL